MKHITAACLMKLLEFILTGVYEKPFSKSTTHCPIFYHLSLSQASFTPILPISSAHFEHCPADLVLRSSNRETILTHRIIIKLASENSILGMHREGELFELPVIDLKEVTLTVLASLQLCYPSGLKASPKPTLRQCKALWIVTRRKYSMTWYLDPKVIGFLSLYNVAHSEMTRHCWILSLKAKAQKAPHVGNFPMERTFRHIPT